MCKVISVSNQKGGVGKTVTSVNLGIGLARAGKKVLIEYVMDCLLSNTTKVCNIKKYILAALFNAPTTMGGYFRAEVNHDMPQLAKAR